MAMGRKRNPLLWSRCECGATVNPHPKEAHVGVFRITREFLIDRFGWEATRRATSPDAIREMFMVPDHVEVTTWVERDRDTLAVRLRGDPLLPFCPDGEYADELDLDHPFLAVWGRDQKPPTLVLANGA